VDTLFDFPLQSVLGRVFADDAPARNLAQVLSHDYLYPDATRLVTFVDLHDMERFMNGKNATFNGLERVFSFLMTTRGIPMIYYGDEIGMKGGRDPDNRRDFPGGWKEDPRNAFEAAGRTPEEQQLVTNLQRLTKLRAESEPLRRGRMVDLLVDDRVYAFARVSGSSRVVVVFNNAAEAATLHVPLAGSGVADGVRLEDCLGGTAPAVAREGAMDVKLPGRSAAVYR